MRILNIIPLLLIIFLSSCHKEYNPTSDLFEIVGDVAQVSALTSPVSAADANSTVNLTIKAHALNTDIKEFKFYQRIGTSGTYTFVRSVLDVGRVVIISNDFSWVVDFWIYHDDRTANIRNKI